MPYGLILISMDGSILFIGNEAVPEGGSAFYFPSELYHNQRDGTFKEVSASANLQINAFVKGKHRRRYQQ